MSAPLQEQTSQRDVDHGLGNVDTLFIIKREPPPACHPAEVSLDDLTARENLEALGCFGSLDDLDHKIEVSRFVHELGSIAGPVGEQVFSPWPALAHGVEDELRA